MLLDNFFYLQMPYGMHRNADGTWYVVNRESMPLGWNDFQRKEMRDRPGAYADIPIHTRYKLSDKQIIDMLDGNGDIIYHDDGTIKWFNFYKKSNVPIHGFWKEYCIVLKKFASIPSEGHY